MIFEDIDNYIENGRVRKTLKACVEIAFDEGYITEENFKKLWEILDKYIPEDKIESFKINIE